MYVKFIHVNKIEARYKVLSLNVKLSENQRVKFTCVYTQVKIT